MDKPECTAISSCWPSRRDQGCNSSIGTQSSIPPCPQNRTAESPSCQDTAQPRSPLPCGLTPHPPTLSPALRTHGSRRGADTAAPQSPMPSPGHHSELPAVCVREPSDNACRMKFCWLLSLDKGTITGSTYFMYNTPDAKAFKHQACLNVFDGIWKSC